MQTLVNQAILWRRIDLPGHDVCRLFQFNDEWWLEGTAVFLSDKRPCRLSYFVVCDLSWNTRRASVTGWLGGEVWVELAIDARDRRWRVNNVETPAVNGCTDVDLNFSPATNLLPIRRLNLEVGEHAQVNAAWLKFPGFELEPLSQIYTRLATSTYRYSSDNGRFVRNLTVNEFGFVTDYPGLWRAEQ